MYRKRQELARIVTSLEGYIQEHCAANPGEYNDFVGESCDAAFHMLQDTLRRMEGEGRGGLV